MSRYTLIYILIATVGIVSSIVLNLLGMHIAALWVVLMVIGYGIVDFCLWMYRLRK